MQQERVEVPLAGLEPSLNFAARCERVPGGNWRGYVTFRSDGRGAGAAVVACAAYLDAPEAQQALPVHGCITFYANLRDVATVGFDTAHPDAKDLILVTPVPGATYRDLEFARAECTRLATVLNDVAKHAARCNCCDKADAGARCSVCKLCFYCSSECQQQAWCAHKMACHIYRQTYEMSRTALRPTSDDAHALRVVARALLK